METSAPLDARLAVNLMLTIHIYGVFSSNHTTFTFEKMILKSDNGNWTRSLLNHYSIGCIFK